LEETRRVHIGEIGVLMLESTAISITAYAMCELLSHKVKVIFCDQQRNPYGELVPCSGAHDSTAKIRQQIGWTKAHKDAVWTEIIRAKIRNQRNVLLHWDRPQAELLTQYLSQLQPADATNREGHAAKVYFNALFGTEFSRALSTPENAALNYGYGREKGTDQIDRFIAEISAGNYGNGYLSAFMDNSELSWQAGIAC
jgi:CRISPR-associated endonuclease Cas1 subtype II